MLAQTIASYRFVSTSLVRQQARRAAEDIVRNVERAVRLSRPQDSNTLRAVLDDVRADMPEQIASVAVFRAEGAVVAATGESGARTTPDAQRVVRDRDAPLEAGVRGDRSVLVGVFPCRCSLPAEASGRSARLFVEVAIYTDALNASFARLRRSAAISAAAALALLVSISLIALRFAPYVRGKQLEAQLEVARQVQSDLLPPPQAVPAGVDVAAHFAPASLVGGDFYDIVTLPDGGVSFVLGDVSGHGVSAALVMSLIHGAMSSPPWGIGQGEADLGAARLNNLLLTKSSGERYASLFWCAYDPGSGVLRYLNAGHLPPLRLRRTMNGSWAIDRLADAGPVLGLLPSATHHVVVEDTREGDALVLFSDGIVEAVNRRDEQFGEERLIAAVKNQVQGSAREIRDSILSAVGAFTEGRAAEDDQTILVVRLGRSVRS